MKLTRSRSVALLVLLALTTSAYKCGAPKQLSTVEGIDRVEDKLNQAANALNALAKTNRQLYANNVINLAERRQVATIINKANAGLDKLVDRVFAIDPNSPGSVGAGKIDVMAMLAAIQAELAKVDFGPPELRAAAQLVIGIVTEAVDLTRAIKEAQ